MVSTVYDFSKVKNLDPEGWKNIGSFAPDDALLARHAALTDLENTIAKSQGRTPCDIKIDANLPPGNGRYDDKTRTIHVSKADLVGDVPPHNAVNTVAHEGRHDYQHQVVNNPDKHPEVSEASKARWAENLEKGNYAKASDNYDKYHGQPVEVDCRQFANLVEHRVCGDRPAQNAAPQAGANPEPPGSDWKAKWKDHAEKTKLPDPPPPPDDTQTRSKGHGR